MPAAARAARPRGEVVYSLPLGERSVTVRVHRSVAPGHLYLNVHQNETTAIEAARVTVDRLGGELYWLDADGERLISFRLQNRRYRFDPNRMFSDVGVEKNLRLYGAFSKEAVAEIRHFANALTHRLALGTRGLVVAVHNSTRGAFSVLSYGEGAPEHPDAAAVSINKARDPDDFFLVTDGPLYEHLRALGYNVVLQANRRVRDNGSLSVWAARNGVSYVNVESQYGHLEQQVEMLAALQGWGAKP